MYWNVPTMLPVLVRGALTVGAAHPTGAERADDFISSDSRAGAEGHAAGEEIIRCYYDLRRSALPGREAPAFLEMI
jgi:hypothetical protein